MKDIISKINESSLNQNLDKIGHQLGDILFKNPDDMQDIISKLMSVITKEINKDDIQFFYEEIEKWIKDHSQN